MSADFWAGYTSGAVGILIGNPLDLIKVRLQAQIPSQPLAAEPTLSRQILPSSSPLRLSSIPATSLSLTQCFQTTKSSLVTGTAAPVLGYGALNALLFVTYNRTEDALNHALAPASSNTVLSNTNGGSTTGSNLWTTWLAGAAGGLATWAISTPTELIKCRAQLASTPNPISFSSSSSSSSSYRIARGILRAEGIRGFYHGGVVTALRDSIGYGFYFWAYEVGSRMITSLLTRQASSIHLDGIDSNSNGLSATAFSTQETIKVLLCGGIAGVVTWASVFPLDVIKTRVQGQAYSTAALDRVVTPLLGTSTTKRKGAVQIAREAYREGGARVFFRGLMVCSVRAFVVNAVQWAAYEWIMLELGQRNHDRRRESHS
ncbi:mitochondrial carrier [Xylariaceae sp. AK1471]|nr:mitochondrial carrier [Xylariaceae sp. AK1471]